jgi:hypothetical protein
MFLLHLAVLVVVMAGCCVSDTPQHPLPGRPLLEWWHRDLRELPSKLGVQQ